eukprot:1748916-Rhodomonas_salina.1
MHEIIYKVSSPTLSLSPSDLLKDTHTRPGSDSVEKPRGVRVIYGMPYCDGVYYTWHVSRSTRRL